MNQDKGASNSSEVPSSLANSVPPSSVAAESMMVNETVPTSSVPSTAPPPGSVPQRTPQQVAPQGASPLPVNQVKSATNITGQPMQPMGGAPQQPSLPPPAAASRTGKEFLPLIKKVGKHFPGKRRCYSEQFISSLRLKLCIIVLVFIPSLFVCVF